MDRLKKCLVVCCAAFVSACATPSNPAYQAKTDALLAKPGDHRVAAPRAFDGAPRDWKPGSWVVVKQVSDGKPGWLKYSILQDSEGLWLQQELWTYDQHSVSKSLFSRMPRSKDEVADLLVKVVTRMNDEPVQVIDLSPGNPAAALYKGMFKSMTMAYPGSLQDAPQEPVTTAGGTFEGAYKYEGSWAFGPITGAAWGWYHPEVPVNGTVKMAGKDGRFTYELLDFGWTGAESAL